MRQRHAQFLLTTRHPCLIIATRVVDVIHVIHRQATRHGIGIEPPPVPEGGVRGDDRKPPLALRLEGVEIGTCHLAPTGRLERVLNLPTQARHQRRVHRLVKQLGRAFPHHPALDII